MKNIIILNRLPLSVLAVVALTTGCANQSALHRSKTTIQSSLPESFVNQSATAQTNGQQFQLRTWLAAIGQPQLTLLIERAFSQNHQLLAAKAQLAGAEQKAKQTMSSDYPEISLNLTQQRAKRVSSDTTQTDNDAQVSLQLNYELDFLGRLDDEQRRSHYDLLKQQAEHSQLQLTIAASVANAWFDVITAGRLLVLFEQRTKNLAKNVKIINDSYKLGLNEALDVYLAENELSQEKARFEQQKQNLLEAKRALQLLIGQYPDAAIEQQSQLPELTSFVVNQIPSEVITQRNDLQSSWYQLLSLDAELAIAHKQRFPRLSLSASITDSDNELTKLLSGNPLAWSLLGNLTQPIFNAGRLASAEEQAKMAVKAQEANYLRLVYQAFAEVENALSATDVLSQRYALILDARASAEQAEKLAFAQYMKGLVSFTTVLDAQRRAVDAQSSEIQLASQLLNNRVKLLQALGGHY